MRIEDIDKNFKPTSACGEENVVFVDCLKSPIKLYGVIPPENDRNYFVRLPEDISKNTNEGVAVFNYHTAGGRIKFKTDSNYIVIRAKLNNLGKMPHFALTGSVGFDLYKNKGGEDIFVGSFFPPFDITDGYESLIYVGENTLTEYTINFPLYTGVVKLEVGLRSDAVLSEASEYQITTPVVYYGSSITQGGCASRPGNSYQGIISRKLNCDHINLGFSGSARGEDIICDYISGLNMSAFVLDYDHNAPTSEHLQLTHEKFFSRIREKNPDLPIIMLSRPKLRLTEDEIRRRDIVKATYENAVAKGDKNVYFIDGSDIFKIFGGDSCTVDDCHPNDLGFMCMAEILIPYLRKVLYKTED